MNACAKQKNKRRVVMFGFKSRRYKKLERITAMLEEEVRRYNEMKISEMISRTTEKKVIPLHCTVTVDTMGFYSQDNLNILISCAKRDVVNRLVDCIGEYVTFEVRELDRDDSRDVTKYEVIGKVEVVEK